MGGTWAVFGSRKSCDHMCAFSLSPPLCLAFVGPPLFPYSLWAYPQVISENPFDHHSLLTAFGDFHQFASRQLSTRCMCGAVHFACASAFIMAHASTTRQPFSRPFVWRVNITSLPLPKNQRLWNPKPDGPSFVGIGISLELYNNLTPSPSPHAPNTHSFPFPLDRSFFSSVMENALNLTDIPTFHSKGRKTQQNPLMGSALHEPLPSFERSRGIRRKRREYLKAQKKDCLSEKQGEGEGEEDDGVEDDDNDDEKTEVKRKVMALQRIVPGGEALGVDKLFEETAGYILALQYQIKAMRVLTSFIEGLEKQKRKLGG